MKIYKGIIKKVPSEKHFEAFNKGELKMQDVKLEDTIIKIQGENGEFDALPIRLSYQEMDENGNEKYTYDEKEDTYFKSYRQTPKLYATGKELRILIDYGEFTPVKVVVDENQQGDTTFMSIACVQNQHMGLE